MSLLLGSGEDDTPSPGAIAASTTAATTTSMTAIKTEQDEDGDNVTSGDNVTQMVNSTLVRLEQVAAGLQDKNNGHSSCDKESTNLNCSNDGHSSTKSTSSTGGDSLASRLEETPTPELDTMIKMFVGQIPRDWDEAECRTLFEEFGEVHKVGVLRDKRTGNSRGCCFVTFCSQTSATDAQAKLHNSRLLPGMRHPVQMKLADSENRNERKLFVGMISKKLNEMEIRKLFSAFGIIDDCTVLRDASGHSRGCAFVTYATRLAAVSSIKAMNHSHTMEGCTSPVVVKFADTQKEKDARRTQQHSIVQQMWSSALNQSVPPSQSASQFASMTTHSSNQSVLSNPYFALATLASAAAAQQQQQHAQQQAQQQLSQQQQQQLASLANLATTFDPLRQMTAAALSANPLLSAVLMSNNVQNVQGPLANSSSHPLGHYRAAAGHQHSGASSNSTGSGASFVQQLTSASLSAANALAAASANFGNGSNGSNGSSGASNNVQASQQVTMNPISKQTEGPEGANLFIYHLPADYGDTDLAQTFVPFGNIVSSKVFIDKQTNLSKCFGFVSYDNQVSALAAIQAMNGFQIANKRLKVQLKRTKEKPY